jgi:hypothetical protein
MPQNNSTRQAMNILLLEMVRIRMCQQKKMNNWMEWMNEWNEWMNEWMNEWIREYKNENEWLNVRIFGFLIEYFNWIDLSLY